MRIIVDGKEKPGHTHDHTSLELTKKDDLVEISIWKHSYDSGHGQYDDHQIKMIVDGEELLEAIKKTLN